MKDFDAVPMEILIALAIISLIELIYHYNLPDEDDEDEAIDPDLNKDGVVTRAELYETIKQEMIKKENRTPKIRTFAKYASLGAIKGAITGLLAYGLEGAAVGAIVGCVISPAITGIEYML